MNSENTKKLWIKYKKTCKDDKRFLRDPSHTKIKYFAKDRLNREYPVYNIDYLPSLAIYSEFQRSLIE